MTDIGHPLDLGDCLHTSVSWQRLPQGGNDDTLSSPARPFWRFCRSLRQAALSAELRNRLSAAQISAHDVFNSQNI